jgi:bifunctional DNA-binding transcriptional regulator/antitoxin component of YhaV-PrlF toxin-antitoxin module
MVRMNSFLQINPSGTLTLPKVLRKALGVAEGGVVMYWTLYPKPRSLEKP